MIKKKAIPAWLQSPLLIRMVRSEIGVILSYWTFQGMLYMDARETSFKIFLSFVISSFLFFFGTPLVVAIILAHTLNMVLNGHYHAMKSHMGRGQISPDTFINETEKIRRRIAIANFISGAAAYGSLARNQFRATSDIDIRIFPKRGTLGWIKALLWIFKERAGAFLNGFPLDIYAFDFDVIDKKMRADEPPIIFSDRDGRLLEKYPDHIYFKDFAEKFRKRYVDGK
jgi:hypothetical protein